MRTTPATSYEIIGPRSLRLNHGELWLNVIKAENPFQIDTPYGKIIVYGTEFVVQIIKERRQEMKVLKGMVAVLVITGMVELVNRIGSQTVNPGEYAYAQQGQPPEKKPAQQQPPKRKDIKPSRYPMKIYLRLTATVSSKDNKKKELVLEDEEAEITLENEGVSYSGKGRLTIWSGCRIILDEDEKVELRDNIKICLDLKGNITSEDKRGKEFSVKKEVEIGILKLLNLLDPDLADFSVELPEDDLDKDLIEVFFKDVEVEEETLSYELFDGVKIWKPLLKEGASVQERAFSLTCTLEFCFQDEQDNQNRVESELKGSLHLVEIKYEGITTFFPIFNLLDREADITLKTPQGSIYDGKGSLKIQAGCKIILEEED
jgi:hypothetical protein